MYSDEYYDTYCQQLGYGLILQWNKCNSNVWKRNVWFEYFFQIMRIEENLRTSYRFFKLWQPMFIGCGIHEKPWIVCSLSRHGFPRDGANSCTMCFICFSSELIQKQVYVYVYTSIQRFAWIFVMSSSWGSFFKAKECYAAYKAKISDIFCVWRRARRTPCPLSTQNSFLHLCLGPLSIENVWLFQMFHSWMVPDFLARLFALFP